MTIQSALYRGTVRHRRHEPRRHEFTYSLFMAFLDIDRIAELMSISPFAGRNRWNWAAFNDRDHLGDPSLPLRERLAADAVARGVPFPEGPVFLLTHLSYHSYNFNPVSFYYCCNRAGEVESVLAEVNNTFGENFNYWLWSGNRVPSPNSMRFRCPKVFHVSPFLPLELDYEFIFTTPGPDLLVHMNTLDGDRVVLDATLKMQRRPWSARELHRGLLAHPWMTAKVIAAIHWEALKLYLKKVPFFTHPGRLRQVDPPDPSSPRPAPP